MSTFYFHLETLYLQFAGYFISNYFEFRDCNESFFTYNLNFVSYLEEIEYEINGEITINYSTKKVEQLSVFIYSGLYQKLSGNEEKAKNKAIELIEDFLFNEDECVITKIKYYD